MPGISPQRWTSLVNAGLRYLASLADSRSSCDYATFNRQACDGLFDLRAPADRDEVDELLADISRRTIATHDVMISCLVHGSGGRRDVSRAFFELAASRGYLPSWATPLQRSLFLAQHIADTYHGYARRPA